MKYEPNQKVRIRKSTIEGDGVFAVEEIKAGEDIGNTHMNDVDGGEMKRIEFGGYINHGGENANIEIKKVKEIHIEVLLKTGENAEHKVIRYYNAFALRDIKVGEEITSNYGADGTDNCPCGLDYVDLLDD